MIRRVVDFALGNRLLILGLAFVLFVWGIISFHNLPIEAYPDVADNYVEIITQWPGIAAEQIEQQVTIPLETSMNGIPGVVHLRSFSLFGLSDLKLIFEDGTENAWNRERVLERLSQVTLPQRRRAPDGHRLEPGRPDLFLHPAQHQSAVRPDGTEVHRRLGGRKKSQVCP
jgi:cobalt-zinc-cadmium resistance protein CzcA